MSKTVKKKSKKNTLRKKKKNLTKKTSTDKQKTNPRHLRVAVPEGACIFRRQKRRDRGGKGGRGRKEVVRATSGMRRKKISKKNRLSPGTAACTLEGAAVPAAVAADKGDARARGPERPRARESAPSAFRDDQPGRRSAPRAKRHRGACGRGGDTAAGQCRCYCRRRRCRCRCRNKQTKKKRKTRNDNKDVQYGHDAEPLL